MPVTSLHKPTGRYLTSFGATAKPGDEVTWSVGHPIFGGEFTTIRLGQVVAQDERGEPLFDEYECDVQVQGNWRKPAVWLTRAEIEAAKKAAGYGPITIDGETYRRSMVGSNWSRSQ